MITDSFKYLVSLDVLLDARLGAVSVLDPAYASQLLEKGWTNRKDDRWMAHSHTFTKDDLITLLKRGDKNVLKHSLPTLMTNYLYTQIRDAHQEAIIGNSVNEHRIVVNTHPYYLTDEEQNELIDILYLKIPNAEDISITSVPMHLISPGYLRGNEITHFVNYELEAWLNMFTKVLMDDPIPAIHMLCPKLLIKHPDETDDPETVKQLLKEMSPFEAMEAQFVMYLGIRFIDVGYFSVVLPSKPA